MNDFAILLVSLGFGALAWVILALSDWLLRNQDERLPGRPVSVIEQFKKKRFGRVIHSNPRSLY